MTDPATITMIVGMVQLLRQAIEGGKALIAEKDDPETKAAIADMLAKLSEVSVEAAELRFLVLEMQAEIASLKRKRDLRERRVYRKMAYYLTDPPPGMAEGPYCQLCWDAKNKPILMQVRPGNSGEWFYCRSCEGSWEWELLERETAKKKTSSPG